jgi:hypothetical protein
VTRWQTLKLSYLTTSSGLWDFTLFQQAKTLERFQCARRTLSLWRFL